MHQAKSESSTIPRSQLRDLNPRPTVYERVGLEGHEVPDCGQAIPAAVGNEISDGSALKSNVTLVDGSSNGLPPHPFAAGAASVRSKLGHALDLLDAGDIAGARAVISATTLELDDGRR
jgi:hypothetical protein